MGECRYAMQFLLKGGLVLSLLLFVYTFFFNLSVVRGNSMNQTIADGDRIVIDRLAMLLGEEIERGDIIVFRSPETTEHDYIKRVVGLPGEVVSITRGEGDGEPGQITIDDQVLSEPYAPGFHPHSNLERRIPAGSYFVLGDNRDRSRDSRYFDLVPRDLIWGKVRLRFWPMGRFTSF